jgi:hypothetical protein
MAGEWILMNRTHKHDPDPAASNKTSGGGGLGGLVFSHQSGWSVRGEYLRLENGFNTPFSALSYTNNREGYRFSCLAPLYRDIVVVSLFYKELKQIHPYETGLEKLEESIYGGSFEVELSSGWGGSLGFMEDDGWNDLARTTDNTNRTTFVAAAGYRFTKVSSVLLEYQRIDGTDWYGESRQDYLTNLYSVYITARF